MANLPHVNGHAEFDPESAALLRDLARGGIPEADMYYEPGSQTHGLGNSHDIEDPAALLEALANFDTPLPNHQDPSAANNHFASLLEAAATAGGEDVSRPPQTRQNDLSAPSNGDAHLLSQAQTTSRTKRKRNADDYPNLNGPASNQSRSVRPRKTDDTDQEQLARERAIWGSSDSENEDPDAIPEIPDYDDLSMDSDPGIQSVHSAAALFRRPTEASKKYTRPPMAKVFTALVISPEVFLRLQSAAKAYMLHPDHPERRDCVGSRGRGDADLVKLKLFNCAETFLEDEGWGERVFGPNAPGASLRKYTWPQAKHKLISLVTPLLRRMVTNERQRQYALQARKSTKKGKDRDEKDVQAHTSEQSTPGVQETETTSPNTIDAKIDPKLAESHSVMDADPTPTGSSTTEQQKIDPGGDEQAGDSELQYQVNIILASRRLVPKLVLSPKSCPSYAILLEQLKGTLKEKNLQVRKVSVHGLRGLIAITSEAEWILAVQEIAETDWLDQIVRVIVEVDNVDEINGVEELNGIEEVGRAEEANKTKDVGKTEEVGKTEGSGKTMEVDRVEKVNTAEELEQGKWVAISPYALSFHKLH